MPPRYSPWSDLLTAAVLGSIGFYFFGLFGAIAGVALAVIIAFGS